MSSAGCETDRVWRKLPSCVRPGTEFVEANGSNRHTARTKMIGQTVKTGCVVNKLLDELVPGGATGRTTTTATSTQHKVHWSLECSASTVARGDGDIHVICAVLY